MEMTQSQVFEVLGLAPETDSGNTPEVAAPAHQEPNNGAPAGTQHSGSGDVQDQTVDGTEQGAAPPEEEPGSGQTSGDSRVEKTPSDEEKRARADAAARRRRQETRAAIDRALEAEREKHRSELDDFFQAAGLKNTITGTPITNMEEFRAWKQAYDAAKLQQDLKEGTLTPEGLEQVIVNLGCLLLFLSS